MNITDFLLARITEDEATAETAAMARNQRNYINTLAGHNWLASRGLVCNADIDPEVDDSGLWDCEGTEGLCMARPVAEHVALHDPARVLAECLAKRAIVGRAEGFGHPSWDAAMFSPQEVKELAIIREEREWDLRVLAAVYADHPDYNKEWAL